MTTTNEWRDLLTMKDVANAKDAGDEIEVGIVGRGWQKWNGGSWSATWQFRAHPRQPKMKKVKALAYLLKDIGGIAHRFEDILVPCEWVRQPHLNLDVEIPE